MSESPKPDLAALAAKLGLYSSTDVSEAAYARILVLGLPKIGKTTALLTTAPKPMIFNCDGDSATKYGAKLLRESESEEKFGGLGYVGIDITKTAQWVNAPALAKRAIDTLGVQTVIVDSLSLLADLILAEQSLTLDGFDLFRELLDLMTTGIRKFMALDAHVFFVAHMCRGYEDEGIIPMIAGKTAAKLPAMVHDIVRFDFNAERSPQRMFLLGPQRDWTYSGRNVKKTTAIPATVPALFAELGIAL